MVEINTRNGVVRVPHTRIVSVYEASASSRWHGTRAIVKVDGEQYPIESTDDAQTIADRCHAAEAGDAIRALAVGSGEAND